MSSGFVATSFNGLNALVGVGIITIPQTLSKMGWMSLVVLVLFGIINFYTATLLKRCMDNNYRIRSYSDVGRVAFGHRGRILISVFMYLELFMVATGLLIVEGDNLYQVFPLLGLHIHGKFYFKGKWLLMSAAGLVMFLSMCIVNLRWLAYVSTAGLFALFVVFGSTLWVGIFDGVGFENEGGKLFDFGGVSMALGLYTYAYGVHPMIPTLYASISDKKHFYKVLLMMFGIGTLNYGAMAVLGYLMFGNNLTSQLTLNLPQDKLSSKLAIYAIVVIPLSKYALLMTPIMEAIESMLPVRFNKRLIHLLIRMLLLLTSLLIAIAFPYYEILMSLVGAILTVSESIIFPCVCFLKIFKAQNLSRLEIVATSMIVIFGLMIAVLGTYSSIQELV